MEGGKLGTEKDDEETSWSTLGNKQTKQVV